MKKKTLSREESKAQTRARILDATLHTLVEEGVLGFSINKVAKRAGIAQPSFYVHFENLDELFAAVTDEAQAQYIEPMQQTLKLLAKDVKREQIPGILNNMFLLALDLIRDKEDFVRMYWVEREQTKSLFSAYLRRLDDMLFTGWGDVLVNVGLVDESERESIRLRIFMDGCMALLERYSTRMMDGDYADNKLIAKTLTEYVLNYWQPEFENFYVTREST